MTAASAPFDLLVPSRPITGISAMVLPMAADGSPDLDEFVALVRRTVEAGLVPAVNMDTGYGNLLTPAERTQVIGAARTVTGDGMLVAGAWVDDAPGAAFDRDALVASVSDVAGAGAVPVIFPHHGLASLGSIETVAAHDAVGAAVDQFIGFELSAQFAPTGTIWALETYAAIMAIDSCIGAKHSSLSRQLEWDRLRLRNARRPDFKVFTGNDLAIDMVMYGSDYLLGLSAFAPDLFAARDRAWATGDPSFCERNDDLQALGSFAFRTPVPAYKHDAARYLHHRGWISSPDTHPNAPTRPDADAAVLAALHERLARWEGQP